MKNLVILLAIIAFGVAAYGDGTGPIAHVFRLTVKGGIVIIFR